MKCIKYFNCLLIALFTLSCHSYEDETDLEKALKLAGKNRKELEKVLFAFESDSLKYKAAVFLIENMIYHQGTPKKISDQWQVVFNEIERLGNQNILTEKRKLEIIDSVCFSNSIEFNNELLDDCKTINSEFLIQNIKMAFESWSNSKWAEKLTFSDFCEYVLPYRVLTEPVCHWREKLYSKLTKQIQDTTFTEMKDYWEFHQRTTYNHIKKEIKLIERFPFNLNIDQMEITKAGMCPQQCAYVIYHLRTVGIPATYDFIPSWGNHNRNHSLVGLAVLSKQVPSPLVNINYPNVNNYNNISNSLSPYYHQFKDGELPRGLYVQHIKTIPKIYRNTWSAQSEMKNIYKDCSVNEIDPSFYCLTMRDVSSQYLSCKDVKLFLPKIKTKIVYLAVFDFGNWRPVAVSRIAREGNVIFKDMGSNIVYLPVVFQRNRFIPIDSPFLLTETGLMKKFLIKGLDKQEIKAVRKYPFFANTAHYAYQFKGAIIEVSNDLSFIASKKIGMVDFYPFYMNTMNVESDDEYRFLRIIPPYDSVTSIVNIAELEVFGEEYNKPVCYSGKPIGIGKDSVSYALPFDKNYETYFWCQGKTRWVGLDLGAKRKVTKIKFCTRNDANCIIPNNIYELFFWNNYQWNSLGVKKADKDFILYENVPVGTLYWLHCITEGQEERIFSYENGRQIWW